MIKELLKSEKFTKELKEFAFDYQKYDKARWEMFYALANNKPLSGNDVYEEFINQRYE